MALLKPYAQSQTTSKQKQHQQLLCKSIRNPFSSHKYGEHLLSTSPSSSCFFLPSFYYSFFFLAVCSSIDIASIQILPAIRYASSIPSFISGYSLKLNQPDFVTPLRNQTVEVGRNATFQCFVTGIEKYRVSSAFIFLSKKD